jgi:hypothetical protein
LPDGIIREFVSVVIPQFWRPPVLGGTVTGGGVSVVDSNSNPLTAGPLYNSAAPAVGEFYYIAPSGITGFTVSWGGTARSNAVAVAEYSGASSVLLAPTGNTASGSGTALSVAPTATASGQVVVGCLSRNAATAQTAVTGTQRQTRSSTSPDIAIMDATSSGATATTVASSVTSSGVWAATGIFLYNRARTSFPFSF